MQVTTKEVEEFINRCYKELGYDKHSLMQTINAKLHRSFHSPLEAQVLPYVLQHLQHSK